ncbi:hypothetical protein BC829DRAFT_397330 [Chytridium lagenaria]|nr:hypothetical protein BC829DRAFT_397330 [Chytridium lagenaria]
MVGSNSIIKSAFLPIQQQQQQQQQMEHLQSPRYPPHPMQQPQYHHHQQQQQEQQQQQPPRYSTTSNITTSSYMSFPSQTQTHPIQQHQQQLQQQPSPTSIPRSHIPHLDVPSPIRTNTTLPVQDLLPISRYVAHHVLSLWSTTTTTPPPQDDYFFFFVDFAARVMRATSIEPSTAVVSLHYMERLHAYLNDNAFLCKSWSEVTGFSTLECAAMRRAFLSCIDHDLSLHEQDHASLLDAFDLFSLSWDAASVLSNHRTSLPPPYTCTTNPAYLFPTRRTFPTVVLSPPHPHLTRGLERLLAAAEMLQRPVVHAWTKEETWWMEQQMLGRNVVVPSSM